MIGTIINVIAVIAGGTSGTLLGERLPSRIRQIVMQGVGLVTLVVGMSMAITTENFVLVLLSIAGRMLSLRRMGCSAWKQPMSRSVNLQRGEPPTGEPCAGEPLARFGGRGDRVNRSFLPLSPRHNRTTRASGMRESMIARARFSQPLQ